MNIGVLFTCYNCEDYVDSCITPWLNLREEYNFIIACNSGMFKDYLELGIPEKNEGTVKKLVSKNLDYLTVLSGKNLIDEDYSRDISLDFLNGGSTGRGAKCDLLIIIDGDEIFTEKNIRDILDFVMKNPDHDGYKISFKNHTIKKGLFTYDYEHDRIFWMNRHGGIKRFYFDNRFEYADHFNGKSDYKYSNSLIIPKSVAYVDHYSWLSEDPRTKDKILYQNKRYSGMNYEVPEGQRCGFEWDHIRDSVKFSPSFWSGRGLQVPILHEMTENEYSFDVKLDFNRSENKLDIASHNLEGDYIFSIHNLNGDPIGEFPLHLLPGLSYWINPTGALNLDSIEDFVGIKVSVYNQERMVHEEKLHFKS